jgi:hypothetical protein
MNRIKLWLYALLVVGAAAAGIRALSLQLRGDALDQLDARLQAAAARATAEQRALAGEASAVAAVAARDPRLLETLHAKEAMPEPPQGRRQKASPSPASDPTAEEAATQEALRAAVAGAEATLGLALPESSTIAGGNREWLARKAQTTGGADREVMDLLTAAIDGKARRGHVHLNGQLWWAAATPAGDGAGLAVLVPLDAAHAQAMAKGAGADVAVVAPGVKLVSTARVSEAEALAAAAVAGPGAARDAGRLAPIALDVLGIELPKVGFLFAEAPAHRVLARPIPGLQGAHVVVSAAAAPALAPVVRMQWLALAGLAVALLVGLVFGLLVGPTEVAARIPPELAAAADRIEHGDFAARAPALAGKLGTLGAALNRAAAAAEAGGASAAGPTLTQEFFVGSASSASAEVGPTAFELPPRAPARAPEPFAAPIPAVAAPAVPAWAASEPAAPRADFGLGLGGGAFEAAPVPAPRATPPEPFPAPAGPSPLATAPALLQGAARAAPAPAVDDEEGHWREVFEDFLRVRRECGEAAEGLTYARFRQKLESNKATLLTKYGCRTVRFQVYVKEGKAALKATPVR